MNWVRAMVALLLVAPLLSQAATTARGRVYLDANGNGHRDWREAGMADELPPPPHYQEFGRKIFAAGLEAGKRRAAEHGA